MVSRDSSARFRIGLGGALALGVMVLALAMWVGVSVGYEPIDWNRFTQDETARTIVLQLRLPRVLLGVLVGSTLALVGAALQGLFRNPLAEPFTLGVSGGGALGASVAIALGFGARVAGIPVVFVFSFVGAAGFVAIVYRLASHRTIILPGALLLGGVVLNLIAGAGVLMIQYLADYTRALQILRWMVGSLDIIGFSILWRMTVCMLPGVALLFWVMRDLHLIAVDEEIASSLGVDVKRCERIVYAASSLVVGVSVAVVGPIGFVGLVVPHAVRLFVGEDLRIVMPAAFLAGGSFLVVADTVARSVMGASELPVGALTALIGGPLFLLLLSSRVRYAAL